MIEEIRIRPYTLDDVPRLFQAAQESIAEVYPWLPWCRPEYSLAEAQQWVEKQVGQFVDGVEFQFAIVAADGQYLGGCGLNQVDPLHRRANLGYWVRTSATRRGAASRAVRLLAAWAFGNTDLVRLEIVAAVENQSSIRVAEKAGAIREGIARSRLIVHGAAHDAAVFSITRGDFGPESGAPPALSHRPAENPAPGRGT